VPIRLQRRPSGLARLDMTKEIGCKEYDEKFHRLQTCLREVALAYRAQGRCGVIAFEGWDAAGKGGAIRRMSWPLDPRGLKVWTIAAPTPDEQGHHYLYRFWKRLPRPGQLAIFDRSWYGRVLVERVEGLATEADWRRFSSMSRRRNNSPASALASRTR
jgi:polyphosphate kinase 2 (PPK2 family)